MLTAQRKPWRTRRSIRSLRKRASHCRKVIFKRVFSSCAATQRKRTRSSKLPCRLFEKLVTESPQNGTRRAQLGLLYAFLGRKEDALREGKRAMELTPITHDVIEGAVVEVFYALICAQVEMNDEAISRIERLLITPFAVDYDDASITLSDLRTRWEWDPLRNDPRFQKILASPEPKTIYK